MWKLKIRCPCRKRCQSEDCLVEQQEEKEEDVIRTESDSIMAESISEVSSSQEILDMGDEGKKKSKFRVFKNFFVKKKKKSSDDTQGGKALKPSLSSSNIMTSLKPIQEGQQIELRSRSSMGNKALSHDSIFMLDPASERPTKQCSPVEVQRGRPLEVSPQHPRNTTFSPARIQSGPTSRKLEETLIDNDMSKNLQKKQLSNKISLKKSLAEPSPESEHLQSAMCSCPSNIHQHADFSIPATNQSCLDSSAARHKMALNPRKQKKKIILIQKPKQEESIPSLVSEEEKNPTRTREAVQKKVKKSNAGLSIKDQNKTDMCDQKTTDQAPNIVVAGNQVHSMSIACGKRCRRKLTLEYGLRRDRLPNPLHDLGNKAEFSPSNKECLLWLQPLEKQGMEVRSNKGDIEKGNAKASFEAKRASEPQLISGDPEFMSGDLSRHHKDEAAGAKKKEVSSSLLPLAERLPTTQEENMLSRAADAQLLMSPSDQSEEQDASSSNAQCKMEQAQSVPTICKEVSCGNVIQVFTGNVPGMTSPSPEGDISTDRLPPRSLPQPLEATRVEKDSTTLKSNSEENSSEEKQTPDDHFQSSWKDKGDPKVLSKSENASKELSNLEKKGTPGYSSQFMRKPQDEAVSHLNTIPEGDNSFERVVPSPAYQSQGKARQGASESKGVRVTSISKDHLIPRPAFHLLQDKGIILDSNSYVEKYNSADDMSSSEEDLSLQQADRTLKKPKEADASSVSTKIPTEECNVSVKQIPPSHPAQPITQNTIQQRGPVEKIPPSHSFQSDLERVAVEWSIIMEKPMAHKAPPKRPRKKLEQRISTPEITSQREVVPVPISPPIAKPIATQEVSAHVQSTILEGNVSMESPKGLPQPLAKPLVKKEIPLGAEGGRIERRVSMESLFPKSSSMHPFNQQQMTVTSRSVSAEDCIAVDPRPPGNSFQLWLNSPMERQVSLFPESKAVERGVSTESLPAKIPPKLPQKPKFHTSMMMSSETVAAEKAVSGDHSKSSSQILPSPAGQQISSAHSNTVEEPILTKPLPARFPPESSGRPHVQSQMIQDTGNPSAQWTNHMELKPANHTLQARINRKFKQHISLCPENAEEEGSIMMETTASRHHSRPRLFSPIQQVSEGLENTATELENSMGSPSPQMPAHSVMRLAINPPVSLGPVSNSAQCSSLVESKPLKPPLQHGMNAAFKQQLSACLENTATQRSISTELRPRRHHSQPPMRTTIKPDMSSSLMSAEWSGPVRPISPGYVYQSWMSPKSEHQVAPDAEALVRMQSLSKDLGFPRQHSPSVGTRDAPKVTSALENLEEFLNGKPAPLKHSPPFFRRSKVKEISSRLENKVVEEDITRKAQAHRDPSQSFVKFMAQQIFSDSPPVEEKVYVDPVASRHRSKSLLKLKVEQQVFSDWGNVVPEGSISFKKPHMKHPQQSWAKPEEPQVFSHSASFPVKNISKKQLPTRKISRVTGKPEYRPDISMSVNFPEEWRSVDEQLLSPYPFQPWKVSEIWPPTASTSSGSVSGEQSNREELLPSRNIFKAFGNTEYWQQVSTGFRRATFENSGNWFLQKNEPLIKKTKKHSPGPEDFFKSILIPINKPGKFIVGPAQTMLNTFDVYSKEDALQGGNENYDNHSCFPTNEMDDVENIFGIRLRKTHSSSKHKSEKQDHVSQLPSQALGPTSSSADKEPKIRRNVSPKCLDNSDYLEPTFNSAETQQSNPKSEGLVKKQPACKIAGKPPGQQSDQATLEPDWITMAKQKQRNFPSCIPMKELNINNTAENKAETNEPKSEDPSSTNELQLKKILTSSIHRHEMGPLKPAKSVAFEDEYTSTKKEAKRSLSLPARLHWPDEPVDPNDGNEPVWFSLAKKKARAWSHMAEVITK
ncbi:acrosomal protein KIAA1210 homolog isoform X2 [Dipodomys merriami]|uniref:acrosomal protein KIAA1210 homolog isoform X2 n=1 Tax=Dipodomys merriami TaxID=94247 RepID=UPI003855BABE